MFQPFAPKGKRRGQISALPMSSRTPLAYRDKDTRRPSLRHVLVSTLSRKSTRIVAFVVVVLFIAWLLGIGGGRERTRLGGGLKVVARDWNVAVGQTPQIARGTVPAPDQTVLILCPMKNSIEHIWHFFHLLDTLTYPRHLLQVGLLVSDTTDRTYERALELADERQYRRRKAERYHSISVFRKDFADEMGHHAEKDVGGKERHAFEVQVNRRKLLAVSRTWLLGAAMTPETDWVMWMDVDVVDYDKDMLQTLIGWSYKETADVVVPNCVWKTYNEMGSYDRNNWAETPESLEIKSKLAPEDVLIEGYEKILVTHRANMADLVPATLDTPDSMRLDGVGGCAALVRASIHRKGAVFPAWPVDHQLETEGFAQLAKKLGAKLVGLPKYYVYHGLYG